MKFLIQNKLFILTNNLLGANCDVSLVLMTSLSTKSRVKFLARSKFTAALICCLCIFNCTTFGSSICIVHMCIPLCAPSGNRIVSDYTESLLGCNCLVFRI